MAKRRTSSQPALKLVGEILAVEPNGRGHIVLTPALAKTCGLDAGNRSMRKACRTAWNEDDWNAAVATEAKMLRLLGGHYAMIAASMLGEPLAGMGHNGDAPLAEAA